MKRRWLTVSIAEKVCAMVEIMLLREEINMRTLNKAERKAVRNHFVQVAREVERKKSFANEIARRMSTRGFSREEFLAFCLWSSERFSAQHGRNFVHGESILFRHLRSYLEVFVRLEASQADPENRA